MIHQMVVPATVERRWQENRAEMNLTKGENREESFQAAAHTGGQRLESSFARKTLDSWWITS